MQCCVPWALIWKAGKVCFWKWSAGLLFGEYQSVSSRGVFWTVNSRHKGTFLFVPSLFKLDCKHKLWIQVYALFSEFLLFFPSCPLPPWRCAATSTLMSSCHNTFKHDNLRSAGSGTRPQPRRALCLNIEGTDGNVEVRLWSDES